MFATSVAYDLVFVVHILAAVATLTVFITMRNAAMSVAKGAGEDVLRAKYPTRRNWAARVLHLLVITGVVMAASGGSSVSFSRPFVGVGLLMYVLAAGHLEARVLPFERKIAAEIAQSGTAPQADGRRLALSIDVLLALVAIALVSMLIQF
jgi:hypothetical protein